MDAFYAAVEQLDQPALRGCPVLVGGAASGRGVIAAASYEARAYGCRSAMPTATALRLCPEAVLLPVRIRRYQEVSQRVFRLFEEFSPLVEPLSIDEAFLDLSGTRALHGEPVEAAARLKARIREETGLTASVGVAKNKFLAKLASDLRKPDGLVNVPTGQGLLLEFLDPLPAARLWGAGRVTQKRLESLSVRSFRDVRLLDPALLTRALGPGALRLQALARGEDDRPVTPDRQAKSISQECTFPQDVDDVEHLRTVLLHQVEDVAYRLRRADLRARTVTLKLRSPEFLTISRSQTLSEPSQATSRLWQSAGSLLDAWAAGRSWPVRLLGIAAGSLLPSAAAQPSLFPDPAAERADRLDRTLDRLRERFGADAVRRRGSGETP